VVGPADIKFPDNSQLSDGPLGEPRAATEVKLGLFLSHSKFETGPGMFDQVGGELSKNVINWVEVEINPQESRAFQVLTIDEKHAVGTSESEIDTSTLEEQASKTPIVPVVGAEVKATDCLFTQFTPVERAGVIDGGVVSLTETICTELATMLA